MNFFSRGKQILGCFGQMWFGVLLAAAFTVSMSWAVETAPPSASDRADRYFKIQVVDGETGRGVPLVELRTVNVIRYITDSNGIVAFYEPGLMDREIFFFVESHGYEFPKDGFGFRGTRLRTTPGGSAVLKVKRLNLAERLYRVTGQGIYRDSVLTGHPVPLRKPVLNGQVVGQDSVFTCAYQGRLFWFWGDTARASYPLGNFSMSAAVSDLPQNGGLDPAVGVNLEYFVDEHGFSRPMAPLPEHGLVWLDGFLTVADPQGQERIVAKYARLKSLSEVLERGLMVYNDKRQLFEPLVRSGVDYLPYSNTGHAFQVKSADRDYYYFTAPSPMAVRLRVRAQWEDVIDEKRYEVLTGLAGKTSEGSPVVPLKEKPSDRSYRWIQFEDLIGANGASKTAVIEALKQESKDVAVYDSATGKKILPHNGTVYFNAFRQRWIGIFVESFGEISFLGEVWYAEADTPVGPWGYARKIVTHNKYSFYNPKQHPLFTQEDGRVLFFEGTYSHTFSGSLETATPRYDYNQIMYRLNVADPRLVLPVAVYEVHREQGGRAYLMRAELAKAKLWNRLESLVFYAIEPARGTSNLIAIYAQQNPPADGAGVALTANHPNPSTTPLFYALPVTGTKEKNSCIVPLYEYRHTGDGSLRYSTENHLPESGWIRGQAPLCRVWKNPSQTVLLDHEAQLR